MYSLTQHPPLLVVAAVSLPLGSGAPVVVMLLLPPPGAVVFLEPPPPLLAMAAVSLPLGTGALVVVMLLLPPPGAVVLLDPAHLRLAQTQHCSDGLRVVILWIPCHFVHLKPFYVFVSLATEK